MTADQIRRINESIAECDRFIAREESRAEDIRPTDIQDLLGQYKAHRERLVNMLSK